MYWRDTDLGVPWPGFEAPFCYLLTGGPDRSLAFQELQFLIFKNGVIALWPPRACYEDQKRQYCDQCCKVLNKCLGFMLSLF